MASRERNQRNDAVQGTPKSDGESRSQAKASSTKERQRTLQPGNRFMFLWLCIALLIVGAVKFKEVVVWVDGKPQLSEKRQAELDKRRKEIMDAEQYVLLAQSPGWYKCLHCVGGRIYLNHREVWKYGVTMKGEKGRYTKEFLSSRNLQYVVQFRGNYAECLLIEKEQIFAYPLLPENLRRPDKFKLVLPPGNLQTN